MNKSRLLIVESHEDVRAQMLRALSSDYDVLLAEDRRLALRLLEKERPPVATLDLALAPTAEESQEGFSTLSEMLQFDPHLKIVIIAGQTEKKTAVEAITRGAHDFLCKPINLDELKIIL